jgi:hypothetical protein
LDNQAYSFVNTNTQTDITLNTKFDSWNYDGIEQIMPWYSNGSQGAITTSSDANGAWWGTLVSTNGFNPAPWMGCCGNDNPGNNMVLGALEKRVLNKKKGSTVS